jgi:integrase
MMRTNILEKLSNIVKEIDNHGSASLTRLTVLKRWFERTERLSAFAIWIATRAVSRQGKTRGGAAKLLREARGMLAGLDKLHPQLDRQMAQTMHARLRVFQNEYRYQKWGAARIVHNWNLMLVVVLGRVTFREQAKAYLHWGITRDREPIKDASSVEAALNKWILPAIGDMPLGDVNNITVKPLVDKMKESLSARSVNTYVEYVQQVVGSLRDGETGEPIHRRKWDSSVMDLPLVNSKQQCRPLLKAGAVNQLVRESDGEEQALYVLLGATGMRISEALALESKHFINGGRTIEVQQQVDRDTPRVVDYVKTDAGFREVDLSKNIAEYLQAFIDSKDRCCSRPETVRLTCTAVSKHVGLQSASKRWGSMSPAWVGTLSADSGRRGCEESDAKRTSTTSGWDTSRKRCRNSIPAWTRNSNNGSKKRRWSASDSMSRLMLLQSAPKYYSN